MDYTKSIGNITELKCLIAFTQMGFDCSIPYGDCSKYDIIKYIALHQFVASVVLGFIQSLAWFLIFVYNPNVFASIPRLQQAEQRYK